MNSFSPKRGTEKLNALISPRNLKTKFSVLNNQRKHNFSLTNDETNLIIRPKKNDLSLPSIYNNQTILNISTNHTSKHSTPNHSSFSNKSSDLKKSNKSRLSYNEALKHIIETTRFPITSSQALQRFMGYLTPYEHSEILEYSQVYFLGLNSVKIFKNSLEKNFGFDDEKFNYCIVINDHLQYRYEVIELIGIGNFSQVCKCFDHKNNEIVVIKIIKNKPKMHRQGIVEVKVLNLLKETSDDSNIVTMKDFFLFRKHLCIVLEVLDISLSSMLKSRSSPGLPIGLIKRYAVQILKSLRNLRKNHIIHCDLKPDNILLKPNSKSELKIIDFGSSCFAFEKLFNIEQVKYYRAPEVILGASYSYSVDI